MHRTVYLLSLCYFLCLNFLQAQPICDEPKGEAVLQGNDVRARFRMIGSFFQDAEGAPQFQVPYSSHTPTPSTMLSEGLWLGAYDENGHLRLSIQPEYIDASDFSPGPIDPGGPAFTAECDAYGHIWHVARWEIEQHQQDYALNGIIDGPVPSSILSWPGRGNPQFAAQMGYNLHHQDLAPFYDRNGNGAYEPMLGDYPVYEHNNPNAIAEELLWWVFSNKGKPSLFQTSLPLLAEVQHTAWSFNQQGNDLINRTIFVRRKIINRSSGTWYDLRAGLRAKMGLGCVEDDYFGTDTAQNTIYYYNKDNDDEVACGSQNSLGYGLHPPVQSLTILNNKLHSTVYHVGLLNFPHSGLSYYHMLSGFWGNGSPITPSGRGYNPTSTLAPVKHLFFDNPNDPNGWSMYSEQILSDDRVRTVSSVHVDSLVSGDHIVLDAAYSFHRRAGNDHLQNINHALTRVSTLQQWYDNGLPIQTSLNPSNCRQNCVYPGDMNNNGIVSKFDLLDWGVAMGQAPTLTPRPTARDNWFPYALPGTDLRHHVDANGNGQIDSADWAVHRDHFGNIHAAYTGMTEGSNAVGHELFFERQYFAGLFPIGPPSLDTVVHRGELVILNAHLGSDAAPIDGAYGLAFEVAYDDAVLEAPNLHNYFGGFALGRHAINGDEHHRSAPSRLHYLTVRTDGQGRHVKGPQEQFRFRVKANAPIHQATMSTVVCFENFKLIDSVGNVISIGAHCDTILYYDSAFVVVAAPTPHADYHLRLYPNPVQDHVTLEFDLNHPEDLTVRVLDMMGRVVYSHPVQQWTAGHHTVRWSTAELPAGVYQCQIATGDGQRVVPLVKTH